MFIEELHGERRKASLLQCARLFPNKIKLYQLAIGVSRIALAGRSLYKFLTSSPCRKALLSRNLQSTSIARHSRALSHSFSTTVACRRQQDVKPMNPRFPLKRAVSAIKCTPNQPFPSIVYRWQFTTSMIYRFHRLAFISLGLPLPTPLPPKFFFRFCFLSTRSVGSSTAILGALLISATPGIKRA